MNHFLKLILLVASVFLFSGHALAQKIKIKKDVLYIDKKETPLKITIDNVPTQISDDFHQIYTFSDASTADVFFYVDYKGIMLPEGRGKNTWLEISDSKRLKTNSVDFTGGLFSSKKKIVLELLNKYHFFDNKGVINQQKIKDFMALTTQSAAKEQALTEIKLGAALREMDPYVSTLDLSIAKGGMNGKPIGRIKVVSAWKYIVYDLDENGIALVEKEDHIPLVKVFLIDKSGFEYRTRYPFYARPYDDHFGSFLNEIVEKLILKGYLLGNQYNEFIATQELETDS